MPIFRQILRFLRLLIVYGVLIVLMLAVLQYSDEPPGVLWNQVANAARNVLFDYFAWEIEALAGKVEQTLFGLHPFMTEETRTQLVREYMADLSAAQALERQVNAIFADPNVSDPQTASAELRTERDHLRANLRQQQGLIEAILEGQVAKVLIDEGFGTLGQLLPPISMRFTEVPNVLIISPRDAIRFEVSLNIDPLPVDQIAALEEQIERDLNVSALIQPLGGVALYPAMILETASIQRATEVFAHEWVHHYLFAFPLGLDYDMAGESRIINETTASIFGQQVGRLVLERYYPDLVPPAPTVASTVPAEPPAFDFGREMDTTRRRVDELLAEGQVEEAEAYMEERRTLFFDNGYLIRKLNQAYFAFYGGYQAPTGVPGVGGADPIGPAVQGILDASPSIYAWVRTMAYITTREALLQQQS